MHKTIMNFFLFSKNYHQLLKMHKTTMNLASFRKLQNDVNDKVEKDQKAPEIK